MKTKVTYAEVKEALENGFISPLNSDVNISEIKLITIESAGRSKDLAEIEDKTINLKEFISLFSDFKKKKENDFLTYTLNVMTGSGWFEITMFNSIKTPVFKDFAHILREFEYLKRNGKI